MLTISQIVGDLAGAFKAVDASGPQGSSRRRVYQPGIGPLTEAEAVKRAVAHLQDLEMEQYTSASPMPYPGTRQLCDLVLPGEWAIEFKLLRPYGDNGIEAEHWSENILHPYPGNTSSIGDCIKLVRSGFIERKAVVVFGYEHTPPKIDLDIAIAAFEAIVTQVAGPVYSLSLGERHCASFDELIHPYHQQGKVYGWEVTSL